MDKPAREAEPLFSQPVRQITLMLIVVVLVGAGGYLAYSRIFPIFLANPWLNGLILAVFLLGVLTCFWQVVQLVASVSWIEGFAARRPGHEQTIAPRMLAPLASLLRSAGPMGSHISSVSSRSILESVATRIDEERDITRYLSNLLIFLGLLGTFYGLATTVPAVVDTIRALAPKEGDTGIGVFDELMKGLEAQLGGMGTAFSSSLLGLAGSLVVGLLELFASHGQNRFYSELEDWLSSFTRLSFARADGEGSGMDQAIVGEVLDQMAQHLEGLRDIYAGSDARRDAINARIEMLAGSLQDLTQRFDATAASLAAATPVLERIAEGQERMITALSAERGDGIVDAESRMRLRSIDVQLLRLLEEVAAGRQESVAELRGDLQRLTRVVRGLGRNEPPSPGMT